MNALLVLIVLCIPLLAVAGLVAAVVGLQRLSRLERRLAEIEQEQLGRITVLRRLQRLEQVVAGLVGEPAATTAAAVERAAGPPAAAAPGPPTRQEEGAPSEDAAPAPEEPPPPPPRPPAPAPPAPAASLPEGGSPPSSTGRRPRPTVSWEQWIGVRGAAVLGGVVLALAALLLFQYSIEQGLITPTMRVVLGLAGGIAGLVGSERLLARRQAAAANALAGAGVVALYASLWAARSVYGLLAAGPAFGLMILVTAVCGLLAFRRTSLVVAVLGLAGGFATPLLVATGVDRPLTLFGYVLVLDAGLLWLARRRGWPLLAALALGGTALHQGVWILGRMDGERVLIGLAVLAVFAAAFVVAGRPDDGPGWRLTMAGAVAVPFAFALHFVGTAKLGAHLAPVGALLLLLALAASWLAGRLDEPLLALGGAGACLGVMALWFASHSLTGALLWEALAVGVALAAAHHLAAELDPGGVGDGVRPRAAALAVGGFLCLLVIAGAATPDMGIWRWLVGWLVLAALAIRGARFGGMQWLQVAAGVGVAEGIFLFTLTHPRSVLPPPWLLAAVVVAVATAAQGVAALWRDPDRRLMADQGAAATALALLAVSVSGLAQGGPPSLWPLVTASVLGLLVVLAATRLGSGAWYLLAVVATAAVHWWCTGARIGHAGSVGAAALGLELATVAVFTGWPLAARARFAASRHAWWGAALAGPLWFVPLKQLYEAQLGEASIGVLPIGLAIMALGATAAVHRAWRRTGPGRETAVVWFPAVALSFVSVAIPLQLEREWMTIGWALNGLAVIALWRRLDHPGLKYLGLALLGAACVRLVVNPAVLGYHSGSRLPVLNWLLYTYLVPVAALLGTAALLRPLEVPRLRTWERELYPRRTALTAAGCALAAVVVAFVWINLTIVDAFAGRGALALSLERMPARDLVTSIAWALYALCLLVIGMRRSSLALRWASLLLFVATIGKVFLHDLGELHDLYRVASLLGLAMALIMVSLFYQRYVLGATSTGEG